MLYVHASSRINAPCAQMKCFAWLHMYILAPATHPSTHSQLEVASYPVLQTGSYTTGDFINTYTYTLCCTIATSPFMPWQVATTCADSALLTTNSQQCECGDCRDYSHKQKGTQNRSQQNVCFSLLVLQGLREQSVTCLN